jgi:AcrR family transcriptional regulator
VAGRQLARRKVPKQARSSATVAAVLEAAAEAFREGGLDGANVNRIAARAGVSVGSLYQYFPSKEAILVALLQRHTEGALERVGEALERGRDAPLADAVRAVVSVLIEVHVSPIDRALARELDRIGRLEEMERAIDARAGTAVAAFLRERAAEITVRDPELTAYLLVRMVEPLTHAMLADRSDVPPEVAVDELTAIVLGYLRARR